MGTDPTNSRCGYVVWYRLMADRSLHLAQRIRFIFVYSFASCHVSINDFGRLVCRTIDGNVCRSFGELPGPLTHKVKIVSLVNGYFIAALKVSHALIGPVLNVIAYHRGQNHGVDGRVGAFTRIFSHGSSIGKDVAVGTGITE
eukprot:scaffold20102_cov261-Amphora_coffeaeformis.AAC.1